MDLFAFDTMGFDIFPKSNAYEPTPDLSGSVILPSPDDLSGSLATPSDDLSGSVNIPGRADLSGTTVLNP